ncbi:uncharacterized protein LOC100371877 [Saccoglossus kowalevskii]|uniref:Leucine-rich repeat-containing protein 46-like n=1 Tax=Saccoglossus kowalevskii TaxID=10224 RepID=A0ABM0GSF4_SACKO|nr:PREDICTED: leucine-rich repeat-containing protein 46-like [Saccoglossus kowalevskii]
MAEGGGDGEAEYVEEETMKKPEKISLSMIARRNLPHLEVSSGSQDKLIQSLMKLTHIRLDRENIDEIDNLEMLGPVTNLYLQHNIISRIENLESLHQLRFLTLAANNISRIENLNVVAELKLLDLSENAIEDFDPAELPQKLIILNLKDNPCTKLPGYRVKVIQHLANLKQLDNVNVTKYERRDAGCVVSDSEEEEEEEEDEDEEGEDDDSDEGVIADGGDWGEILDQGKHLKNRALDNIEDVFNISTRLIQQSRQRLQKYMKDHASREDELDDVRTQSRLADEKMTARENEFRLSVGSTPTPR